MVFNSRIDTISTVFQTAAQQDGTKKISLQYLQKHFISAKIPRARLISEKSVFSQVSPDTCISDLVGDCISTTGPFPTQHSLFNLFRE